MALGIGREFVRHFLQARIHRGEGLGEHAGLADDGHEIGVAGPAGDDVGVEVRDAAAGGGAEIETDIEGVGTDRGGEHLFAEDDLIHQVGPVLVVFLAD